MGFFSGFFFGVFVTLLGIGWLFWKSRKGLALIGVAKNSMQAVETIMKMVEKSPTIKEELKKRL